MLRKTVTSHHGEGSAEAAKAGEANDTAKLADATARAKAALTDLDEQQAREDAERQARARANARSGIKTFSGCVC